VPYLLIVSLTITGILVIVKVTINNGGVTELPPGTTSIAVAVDLVMLTVRDGVFSVLLITRGLVPYKGRWALPGGFVTDGEDLPDAAERELEEETGVATPGAHLEQLGTYGAPRRDPRGRVLSVAYLALLPETPMPAAGSDAADARWTAVDKVLADDHLLAFDHHQIVADGVERARAKLEYSPLATAFCPPSFTIAELRRVYETVWGTLLDARNFHRKVTGTPGFVAPTGTTTTRDGGRPAQLYRRGHAPLLHPAMLRP
jgi:8-oxo-dGTP diphosphatase